MSERGYIKLYRKILSSAVFANAELYKLFSMCLCRANHKQQWVHIEGVNEPVRVRAGQFITGRDSLHRCYYPRKKRSDKSPLTVWRWLKLLEKMQMVIISSYNYYSIVTVCNWDRYQQRQNPDDQADGQQLNNGCSTDEQRMNTNNNDKKDKNEQQTELVCCDSDSALARRAGRHTAHVLQVSRDKGRMWERSVVFKIMQGLCRTHRDSEIAWVIEHTGPYANTPGLIRDTVMKKPTAAEIRAREKRKAAARIEQQRRETELRANALPPEEFRRRIRQTREMLAQRTDPCKNKVERRAGIPDLAQLLQRD